MNYKNRFSNGLTPPVEMGFSSIILDSNAQAYWPSSYPGIGVVITEIMEFSCADGNILQLPAANEVSEGASFLLRNMGSYPLIVDNALLSVITTVPPGTAQLLYVKDNATVAGLWGVILYGVGSASISAGALAGFGTKAIGSQLSVASPVLATNSNLTLAPLHRGSTVEFTGGAATLTLGYTADYEGDFYCLVKNAGSGQVTLAPSGAELIDGISLLGVQPDESFILVCTGAGNWITIGRGRSTLFQFSNLSLDVSAGGTFTLTSTQASNKMLTFTGNPSASVTIVVPSLVSVYYVANNLSTNQNIQVKTATLAGASIGQTQRAVLLCDGTSVTAAQSVVVNSAVAILDGSELAPSLNFSSQANTGLYKYSTKGIGVAVNGVAQMYSNGLGMEFPLGITQGGVKYKTSNTGSLQLPIGTTLQRDGDEGSIRANKDTKKFEGFLNGKYQDIGGGQMLGQADVKAVGYNAQIINEAIVVKAGTNAFSVAPIEFGLSGSISFEAGTCWKFI